MARLLFLLKLFISRATAIIVGKHYPKLLTLYNFCSWEAEIVQTSKQAVLFDFAYKNREVLYSWVNQEVIQNAPIDYLEFGVYQGESIRKWCGLNNNPESRFIGFDSFEGLPENWEGKCDAGTFSTGGGGRT